MKFRNNINYFKKKDVIKSIGIVLLVLGAILLFVNFGYISWILMILFISSGFLMSIIGSIISSNEGDMDEYISRECMGLDTVFCPDQR